MKRLFTPDTKEKEGKLNIQKERVEGPRAETVDFLKAFARICRSETKLKREYNVLILN